MPRVLLLLVTCLVATVLLLAGACGDEDTATTAPTTATPATATATTAPGTTTPTASPTATVTTTAIATTTETTTPTATETATATETETATATGTPTATPTATSTQTATPEPTGTADERADLIAQFPSEVQGLLEEHDLPANVLQLLLDVRNQGPETVFVSEPGGEYADSVDRAYFDEWEQITGWTVEHSAYITLAELEAKVTTGNPEWDMVVISPAQARVAYDNNWIEAIDQTVLQQALEAWPTQYSFFEVTDYGLTEGFSFAILIWNTDIWPMDGKHPESVVDVFNTEDFPGKRCLYGYPQYAGTLEYALMADGVPADEIYPLDVERALRKLDTIKDDIVWWNSGAESIQFVLDGQCELGTTWHGRPAVRLREEPDLPIGWTFKDSFISTDMWTIPAGARADVAMSMMAWLYTPQNQCDFANQIGYAIPLDTSCYDDFGNTWGATDENLAGANAEDYNYYYENIEALSDQFAQWQTE